MNIPFVKGYFASLKNPAMMSMAVRVALVVGSILFTINHGAAVAKGEMTKGRWISAALTYCVPYAVSVHGQYIAQRRRAIAQASQVLETKLEKELLPR